MDAKRLIQKSQSGMLPLSAETIRDLSASNILTDFINSGIKPRGLNTASKKLLSAIDKVQDRERLKEYTRNIAEKWKIEEALISDAIQTVIIIVLIPMLQDEYNIHKEVQKAKEELADIKRLLRKIEGGSIKTLEITLKATAKTGPEDVQIKSNIVVNLIYKCLKTLPDAEIKAKAKGRPKGSVALENAKMKYCAEMFKRDFIHDSEIELYEFIGDIFEATGLYYEEGEVISKLIAKELKYETYKEYKVQNAKALLKG